MNIDLTTEDYETIKDIFNCISALPINKEVIKSAEVIWDKLDEAGIKDKDWEVSIEKEFDKISELQDIKKDTIKQLNKLIKNLKE